MPAQNFAQYLRTLQILFFGLFAAQLLVCGLFWFVLENPDPSPALQEDRWLQALTTITLLLLGLSIYFRKKQSEKARTQETLRTKLGQYRPALVISWAIMEGATLVNAVFFFLSGKIEFLYIAGAVIALYATNLPSKIKTINDLQLDTNEQAELDDPNAEVADTPTRGV